jgi:hypothetical protein
VALCRQQKQASIFRLFTQHNLASDIAVILLQQALGPRQFTRINELFFQFRSCLAYVSYSLQIIKTHLPENIRASGAHLSAKSSYSIWLHLFYHSFFVCNLYFIAITLNNIW